MSQTLVGQPILRVEDERFLTGRGRYTDDYLYDDLLYGAVLRSPHAHARIVEIDTSDASTIPGVVEVLTSENIRDIEPFPTILGIDPNVLRDRNGELPKSPTQWPLASDKVRYVGDPVAFVIAETPEQAKDAIEAIDVSYQPLTAVIAYEDALAGNVKVWEEFDDNRAFEWAEGDRDAVDDAFTKAAAIAEIEVENTRQIVSFMEPRSIVANFDPQQQILSVRLGAQSAHSIRNVLALILRLETEQVHVIAPDTGGGFGARNIVYPEFVLACYAARRLGRTIRWTAERSESFLTDTQARDQKVKAALALDRQGRFLAIRTQVNWRHGALVPTRSHWVMITFMPLMMCGSYDIGASYFEMTGLFSNTGPVHAFRGVGRAEAAYIVERLVDRAARVTGIDRVELRRRNLATTPCKTASGARYGTSNFGANLDMALRQIDWAGFETRRAESRERGKLRGLGIANYVESTGGMPTEFAQVDVLQDKVVAYVGTKSFGMGHETVYAQVLADELGIAMDVIEVCDGDTKLIKTGAGSHGSRSMRIGGGALVLGARQMLDNAKQKAGEHLEAAVADIDYTNGIFEIAGTDKRISLFELSELAFSHDEPLSGEAMFETHNHAFANGCHVCEVEIDPETGVLEVVNHILITDVGNVVNPLIVSGQLHGGIAQGLGQALWEHVVYEPEEGQLLSGSFMDYTLPRADDLCWLEVGFNEVACEDNPLGVKGAGEGPTTGSPPAAVSAVLDALSPLGIEHVDMPLTSERLWQYIRQSTPTM